MTDLEKPSIAAALDHTLLSPTATTEQIQTLCDEARQYAFHSVCIAGRWVSPVADRLHGSGVKVTSVIGFPLGSETTRTKAAQAKELIFAGADELDMVIDLAAVIEEDAQAIQHQLKTLIGVCRSVRPEVTLKVIIEAAALTHDQKVFACRQVQAAGVPFLKTSTGLHAAGGATLEDVRLMKDQAPNCKVKAAGGIRTAQQALAFLDAGADRLGTSAGVAIVHEINSGGE